MAITRKSQSDIAIRKTVHLLALSALFTSMAYGQAEPNQTGEAAGAADEINVSDAMANAKEDTPDSIYYVEQLAQAKAVQAIPMLEDKFVRTQASLDKAHIASALVRLGDKSGVFWDFLVKGATLAVQSDVPNYMSYDAQGKSLPGPSPQYAAWARAHNLPPDETEQPLYMIPGPVGLLGLTADPRAVPLLRRALSSRNYMIQILAAEGLAEIGDKDSIPFIIAACRKAPAEAAATIAKALVYFDDPAAQSAVDAYVPKDIAKTLRDAKAHGKKKPWSN